MVETEIGARETSGELEQRLSTLAVPLTLEVIAQIEEGPPRTATPQDPELVTLAPRMQKRMGLIDWSKPAREIDCHIRAMQPWPMPFTFLFHEERPPVRTLIHEVSRGTASDVVANSSPGRISTPDGERLFVATGDDALEVLRLQPAGKRIMAAADFLRGHSISNADRFGAD